MYDCDSIICRARRPGRLISAAVYIICSDRMMLEGLLSWILHYMIVAAG